ncbi:MAG: glycosyltransferase family 2 protein [Flavobacteriaceae bacterium]|nr:glycosyltransferase family 2 protein [Flavobacteriaceae bacterium]
MPKFSVVIAVYNKAGFVGKTIESVLAQTFQDFELLILNDGSTDDSEAEIKTYLNDDRISYFSEENKGVSAARNFLIEKSNSPYIAFLDADDYWYPNFLAEQNRLAEKYPMESVFATASEFQKGKTTHIKNYSVKTKDIQDTLVNFFEASNLDCILHSSTFVVKKEVFDQVGYYNENLKTGEDTDLYVRIGLKYKVVFSPKICVRYQVLEDSLSRTNTDLEYKATFEAYESFEDDNPALKKYLDLNRYSISMLAKSQSNKDVFKRLSQKIDLSNLSGKQRFLLKSPAFVYQLTKGIQKMLMDMGIRLSSFKG